MSTDAMRAALEQLSFVFVNAGETAAEAIRRVRDVARAALAQPVSAERVPLTDEAAPVATDARSMLEFLSARFKHAGVSEAVAESYARDIDAILAAEASPTRVPLTDDQIVDATEHIDTSRNGYFVHIARAIERAHGIGEPK